MRDARKQPTLRELLRWLRGITRPVHGYLAASVGFRIINLTLDVGLFAAAGGAVVHLLTGGDGLGKLIVVLATLAVLKGTAYYLEQFMGHHVAFKAVELLRDHVYGNLWPKAPAVAEHTRSGDTFATLTRDVDRIDIVYAHTIGRVISAYVVGIGIAILALTWVGWAPLAVAIACLALSLLVVPYLGLRSALRRTAQTLEERGDLAHHLTDTVFGLEEVLGYGRAEQRVAATESYGRRIAGHSQRARNIMAIRRAANTILMLCAAGSVVVLGMEQLPIAAVAALAAGTLRAFEGARAVEDASGYLDHAVAAARRLWALTHAPTRVHDGPDELSLAHAPAVRFDDVHFTYPDAPGSSGRARPAALRGATLDVPAGTHAVLVGRSGSGKSTLVQLLLRYDDPTSGRITLDGEPVSKYTLGSLRSAVASVSQRSQLLKTTIADNLRLGAPDASDEDLWEALTIAAVAGEVRAMPDGLDTHVGQSSINLSGGQVQRLCLARALLIRPRVLVLDEFTAHLNTNLENVIRANLREHSGGVTIIEVTHRLRAVTHADVVAVVESGRIVAQGSPGEIPLTGLLTPTP